MGLLTALLTSPVLECLWPLLGCSLISEPVTVSGDKVTFGSVRSTPGPGDGVSYKWEGWIPAMNAGKVVIKWPRTHSSNLCQTQKNLTGCVYRAKWNNVLCREVVLPALNYLEYFPFLKPCLPKVAKGKIGTWSLPFLLSFPVGSDILHWFLFFPLSVLWFCYLDKVLSLVFSLSNIELSSVRQQTSYRGMDNTETFCLSVPWPKILALSYREKVKRDIWTNG